MQEFLVYLVIGGQVFLESTLMAFSRRAVTIDMTGLHSHTNIITCSHSYCIAFVEVLSKTLVVFRKLYKNNIQTKTN